MLFTKPHKQYLEAMGLVPWVRRDTKLEAVPGELVEREEIVESIEVAKEAEVARTTESAIEIDQNGVIESIYRGSKALVHGEPTASLLWIFEAAPGQTDLTLDAADNRLVLDMLKAIGLDERSVARCLVSTATTPITQSSIDAICHSADLPLSACLKVVAESPDITSDDQADSRLSTEPSAVPVWRIPHPSWIQQEPALKRRAWNVLKAVRTALTPTAQ